MYNAKWVSIHLRLVILWPLTSLSLQTILPARLIGKNKAIELKTINYDSTIDLTTFTLEIKRNRGKR